MADRQELLGHLRVAAFGNRVVVAAPLAQAGIAAPVVGGDGQPDATGIATILPLVLRSARLPVADLDGSRHQRLVVDATAFATSPASNIGFVHLNMLSGPAADPVLIGGRTMPARSLCRMPKAVSYRVSPSCR